MDKSLTGHKEAQNVIIVTIISYVTDFKWIMKRVIPMQTGVKLPKGIRIIQNHTWWDSHRISFCSIS